jgi:hypothetical protein
MTKFEFCNDKVSDDSFEVIEYDKPLENFTADLQHGLAASTFNGFVNSFSDLQATIYPPDPDYNVAEKPWLPGPQTPYMLVNANLVDPRAGIVRKAMTLRLAGGEVLSVSATSANDLKADFIYMGRKVQKIDVKDFFVCPGLIDCEIPRFQSI